jgi:hypothetical protein
MAEIDLFERSLAGAFLRLADDVPGTVDAAAVAHRVALEHPRRRARVLSWGSVAIPRPAWVLLLLAGLLVALVGGALLVGSQQRRLPAVVPPVGPAFECPPGSTPDEPGPVDQARPPQNSNASVAFDRRAGRLVAFTSAETWTFDVCTNTWTQQHPDQEPLGVDGWSLFVYDVDSDLTIAVDRNDGTVWAYDLQADIWTRKGNGPVAARLGAYDPLTGLVVAATDADPAELWTYDVETDTWTPIDRTKGPDYAAIAYDASVDRLVAYGDAAYGSHPYETWLFDIRSGTWSRSAAERPAVVGWLTAPGLVYDEAAERTVVLMRTPVTAYDATADRWETLPEAPATWPYADWPYPGAMVYDAVNRRLVGLGQTQGTPDVDIPPGGVEALDLVKGERRVLLERVGGQAAP